MLVRGWIQRLKVVREVCKGALQLFRGFHGIPVDEMRFARSLLAMCNCECVVYCAKSESSGGQFNGGAP